jgi:hypothetical protein
MYSWLLRLVLELDACAAILLKVVNALESRSSDGDRMTAEAL